MGGSTATHFGPWGAAVAGLLTASGELATELDPAARPWLALLAPEAVPAAPPGPIARESRYARPALFDAVRALLVAAARRGPLAVRLPGLAGAGPDARRLAAVLEPALAADRVELVACDGAATAPPDGATDVAALTRAGHEALAACAVETAAACFARAGDALDRGDERLPALLLALGHARVRAGDEPDARAALLEAAELARAHDDQETLARAALDLGDPEVLHEALAGLGGENPAVRARLLARLTAVSTTADDALRRRGMAEEALTLSHDHGGPRTRGFVLLYATGALDDPALLERRVTNAAELQGLGRRHGEPEWLACALLHRICADVEVGDTAGLPADRAALRAVLRPLGTFRPPWLTADHAAVLATLGEDDEPAVHGATLRRAGEVWTIECDGRVLHVRDSRGLRHLATLLARPGTEIHALELVGGATTDDGAGLGPQLDAQAKREYRRRMAELTAALDDAETRHDPRRAAAARDELEFLRRELAGALGLGGRDREAATDQERARMSVTRAIRTAIRHVAALDEALGRELEATVRTGTFCVHAPDGRRPRRWTVEP